MKKLFISIVVFVGFLVIVVLVGCKKKEDIVDNNVQLVVMIFVLILVLVFELMVVVVVVNVFSVIVGKMVVVDKMVVLVVLFVLKDEILVLVCIDGMVNNVILVVKLIYQDGQVVGEQIYMFNIIGVEIFNLKFMNVNGWLVGKYCVEVMVDGKVVGMLQEFEVK